MTTRRKGIAVGTSVVLDELMWTVTAIEGTVVALSRDASEDVLRVDVNELLADRTFGVVLTREEQTAQARGNELLLRAAGATPEDWDAAVRLARHLEEVRTGFAALPDEDPQTSVPRPEFDLEATTQQERIAVKARQLSEAGQKTSERTLRRRLDAYRDEGVAGLFPRTPAERVRRWKATSPPYVRALAEAIAEDRSQPEGSKKRVLAVADRAFAADPEANGMTIPSRATQYRLFDELAPMLGWREGRRKYVQSAASRPVATHLPVDPIVPGERLELDSTDLNVFVRNPVTKAVYRPEMAYAMDVATRTVPALRIQRTTNHWLVKQMVLDAMRPKPPVPFVRTDAYVNTLGLPAEILTKVFPNVAPETRLSPGPVMLPQTVVVDQGKAYVSREVKTAMAGLGIAIEESRPGTPTDKPHVERGFKTLETLLERLPGYTSKDVMGRGRGFRPKDEERLLTERELETVIWAWLAFDYHQRPHLGLNVPVGRHGTARLSPMDMYRLLVTQHGFIPAPVDQDVRYEFMDSAERVISDDGIRFSNLVFDAPALKPFRKATCPWTRTRKWPIRVDPMDVRSVYVLLPVAERRQWVEVPWKDTPRDLHFPFPMEALEFVIDGASKANGKVRGDGLDVSLHLSEEVRTFMNWLVEHADEDPSDGTLTERQSDVIASVSNAILDKERASLMDKLLVRPDQPHDVAFGVSSRLEDGDEWFDAEDHVDESDGDEDGDEDGDDAIFSESDWRL